MQNMKFKGHRLKSLRDKLGLTGTALADISGVRQHIISKMENEKINPEYQTVDKLASALGVQPLYFFLEDIGFVHEISSAIPDELTERIKPDDLLDILKVLQEINRKNIPCAYLLDFLKILNNLKAKGKSVDEFMDTLKEHYN
jgi:transcriptional regulator with XRE-family HTH domain